VADFVPEPIVLELISPDLETSPRAIDALFPAFEALARDLWPRGRLWRAEAGSTQAELLAGLALEIAEIEISTRTLLREMTPETTHHLLVEWERALGLPDPCLGIGADEEARRAAIVARLVGLAGATQAEILSFLASLGYVVTLEEHEPSGAGTTFAGDLLTPGAWRFVLTVHYWGALDRARLECSLSHRLPAHVVARFLYGEATPEPIVLELIPQEINFP